MKVHEIAERLAQHGFKVQKTIETDLPEIEDDEITLCGAVHVQVGSKYMIAHGWMEAEDEMVHMPERHRGEKGLELLLKDVKDLEDKASASAAAEAARWPRGRVYGLEG